MKRGAVKNQNQEKQDFINPKKYDGVIRNDWRVLRKFGVIFTDGTKGDIRTSKSKKDLIATGKYKHVAEVKREPYSGSI